MAASVHRRIVRIAEQAFWDGQAEALAADQGNGGPGTASQMAALLSQLGTDVLAVIPERVRKLSSICCI